MPRRTILTERQRKALFDLPDDEASILKHYILSDEDLKNIRRRRKAHNRLGFALQLCAFRYPGRLLQPKEFIPTRVLSFIGAQIGIAENDLAEYAKRAETRYEHSSTIQDLYGYRPFAGDLRLNMESWLVEAAETTRTNDLLAANFLEELRQRKIIVPGISTVERLCADALVEAERLVSSRICNHLTNEDIAQLNSLLTETVDGRVSRFVWLRQREPGSNSTAINKLLDRYDYLQTFGFDGSIFNETPPLRIGRLRRQGERYYADGMRDLPEERRNAILAVCILEWRALVIDAIVESHDRVVGKLYRACERKRDSLLSDRRASIRDTLRSFTRMGQAILSAHEEKSDIDNTIATNGGWELFETLVQNATTLTGDIESDPLEFVVDGYARFKRYIGRFLNLLVFKGGRSSHALLEALEVLKNLNSRSKSVVPVSFPTAFLRPKWRRYVFSDGKTDRRYWEIAVLFEIRNALRSGDVWLPDSKRYGKLETAVLPEAAIASCTQLAVPHRYEQWIESRQEILSHNLQATEKAAKSGSLPNSAIEKGKLLIERLERTVPEDAHSLVNQLYAGVPRIQITDLLWDVDAATGFCDAFTDLRTGVPCGDRTGVLTVLLADGLNLGLRKMADACDSHGFWELLRIGRWHIREETIARALASILEAQQDLPLARFWGSGLTSSSDGQFFPAGGTGEAMNVVNARYDNDPGLKAYSHISDRYAPFSTQVIPATAHEAPYILDGLLQNDTGQKIKEHYADTGGFTDHVFAVCSILGYRFAPRIRDLPDKRLYAFTPNSVGSMLRPLVAGRIKVDLIRDYWPDILQLAASMAAGAVVPSQVLRKLAAYPRQNKLAVALREIGRLERSIFMLEWLGDLDLQRRAQVGLNKGEAHHALKRAINFHRRGEIRDRTMEGQHYRIASLNLLAAIIIYWNTVKLGDAVKDLTAKGTPPDADLLPHVSPLGWEHITLTGRYRWANA